MVGSAARPRPEEEAAAREKHIPAGSRSDSTCAGCPREPRASGLPRTMANRQSLLLLSLEHLATAQSYRPKRQERLITLQAIVPQFSQQVNTPAAHPENNAARPDRPAPNNQPEANRAEPNRPPAAQPNNQPDRPEANRPPTAQPNNRPQPNQNEPAQRSQTPPPSERSQPQRTSTPAETKRPAQEQQHAQSGVQKPEEKKQDKQPKKDEAPPPQ